MCGIYRQDVDMVLGPLSITPERETVVDFTYPIWEEAIGMLTLTVPGNGFYFLKPLQIYAWSCFVCVLIAAALIVRAYECSIVHSENSFSRFAVSLWYFYGMLWAQGKFQWVNQLSGHQLGSNDAGMDIIQIIYIQGGNYDINVHIQNFVLKHQENGNKFSCVI